MIFYCYLLAAIFVFILPKHSVSFNGSDPKHFTPVIDAKCLSWCPKLKYLGCISSVVLVR